MWKGADLRLLVSVYSVVIFLPATQAPTPDYDLNDLTPELMTPVFDLMRTRGEGMRDGITATWNVREEARPQQYLLVAIMSREEVELVSRSGRFPDAFFREIEGGDEYTLVMHRVLFALNQDKGVNKGLYSKSRHTEVAVIDLGYLDDALGRFDEDHENAEYPLIVMYSHYIPCAGVPKLGYSCAQEIHNYAIHRHEDRGFIVAFTEMFANTDPLCSRRFMREAGVPLFQYKPANGRYVRIENFVTPAPRSAEDERTLQGYLYDAVIRVIAVSRDCCMGDVENKQKIVAFFVNEITYRCTYNSHKARGVTKLGQFQLYKCMSPFLKETLGNECSVCKERFKRPQIFIDKLDKALCSALGEAADDFIPAGKPPSSNALSIYAPTWEPFDGPWSGLYDRAPSLQVHALPPVECADPTLSKISLCTKSKADTDTFSSPSDVVALRPGVEMAPQPLETLVLEKDRVLPYTQ